MSTQHTVYATKLCDHLSKWVKRKSRKLPSEWLSDEYKKVEGDTKKLIKSLRKRL